MKIRQGFVSNSSSSSFLIYGISFSDKSEVNEIINKYNEGKPEDEQFDCDDAYEYFEHFGLYFAQPYDYDCYVGVSWDSVGDDETGKQFKENTYKALKEAVPDIHPDNLSTLEEAWRDG